jgi:hypothetical protein
VITKRGSVERKHKEDVIERAPHNISRVTFPTSNTHKACGAARTSAGT